jgi:D-alanine transaminase
MKFNGENQILKQCFSKGAPMLAFFNGRYLPQDEIVISPDDRGFLFADGLYEVIRSYQGNLFQTRSHLERLNYGARTLRFKTTDFHYLAETAAKLIRENDLIEGEATVYFQVTRGAAPRTHAFPDPKTDLTVYLTARPFSPHRNDLEKGVNIFLVSDQRWARCDIKTVGLTANVLAHQLARERQAQEAVFVRDGVLLEGTHTNLFAVVEGTVVTSPLTNYILGGITRLVVLELCRKLGLPFREAPVFEADLERVEELMIVGTTTEVTPVVKINGRPFQSGEPGRITRLLQKALRELTQQPA